MRSCHGLLVAADLQLAFAACGGESGRELLTFNLETKSQSSLEPIPPRADVVAFDQVRKGIYVASSTGKLTVFQVTADRQLTNAGEGFVGPNAHTVSVDPQSHRVYFPLESLRSRAVLRVMEDP